MRSRLGTLVAGFMLAGLLVSGGSSPMSAQASSSPELGIEVGEPFPLLSLPTLEGGGEKTLADFRGQKVILHVFASW